MKPERCKEVENGAAKAAPPNPSSLRQLRTEILVLAAGGVGDLVDLGEGEGERMAELFGEGAPEIAYLLLGVSGLVTSSLTAIAFRLCWIIRR